MAAPSPLEPIGSRDSGVLVSLVGLLTHRSGPRLLGGVKSHVRTDYPGIRLSG